MAEHVKIPRLPQLDFGAPGPWWWPFNQPPGAPQAPAPLIRCPEGHRAFLTRHNVAGDGTVSPPIVCPEEACTWHVMGQLVGWDQGERAGKR